MARRIAIQSLKWEATKSRVGRRVVPELREG
jgi:hypothetical protein